MENSVVARNTRENSLGTAVPIGLLLEKIVAYSSPLLVSLWTFDACTTLTSYTKSQKILSFENIK